MKRKMLSLSSLVASFSFVIALLNVNSTCIFLAHQPELPKGVEKLSKH